MSLKRLKGYTEKLLEPASSLLSRHGVTPNHITTLGVLFSLGCGILYYFGHNRLAAVALALSGICDLLDGNLARTQNKETPFGAFLDSTFDRYSDMLALFGILGHAFATQNASLFWWTAASVVGSFMVSYTRARAECIIDRCDVGLMERPERMVVLFLFSLADSVLTGVILIAVFANITAVQRILHTREKTKDADSI